MAAIPVTISGVLVDKYGRTIQQVTLFGDLSRSDRQVGGGPMPPGEPVDPDYGIPEGGHIWGPTDPRPSNPISGIPGLPGYEPPPIEPPTGEPDNDGFIKPPPPEGGWAYHQVYGWMYDPREGASGPKR